MSIDITTLAVSKNYTDKQIEKASIKGADLSGYLQRTELTGAINTALAQAKTSGEFNGKDGKDGENGKDGADGKNYVLTDDDLAEIAEQAAELVEVPEGGNVEMKPLTFTGAVNATYDGSEAVEVVIPQGGGSGGSDWYLVNTVVTTEEVTSINITEDSAGNAFSLDNVCVLLYVPYNALGAKCSISMRGQWDTFIDTFDISSAYSSDQLMYKRENISKGSKRFYVMTTLKGFSVKSGNFTAYPAIEILVRITTADKLFPVGTVVEVYTK